MTPTDRRHNSLGGNAADQLRAYVRRVEWLEEEIAGLNDDKREIYSEAKACGFCKSTLRRVIARRRRSNQELQEADELLQLYESALAATPDEHDVGT